MIIIARDHKGVELGRFDTAKAKRIDTPRAVDWPCFRGADTNGKACDTCGNTMCRFNEVWESRDSGSDGYDN